MYTGWYLPNDWWVDQTQWSFHRNDQSVNANVYSRNEGPSYCVRLLVFSYEDCL